MKLRRHHRWLFLIVTLTAFIVSETASLAHACVDESVRSHPHHAMGEDAATGRSTARQHCHACPDNGTRKADPWCAFHCQGSVATQPPPSVLAFPPCAFLHDLVLAPSGNGDVAVATLPALHVSPLTSSRRSILARFCALLI